MSTDPKDLAKSAGLALALLALIAFPSEVFNATFEENSGEIRAWFRRPRRALASAGRVRQSVLYGVFLAIGGLLYAAVNPDFGLDVSSFALAAGIAGGLGVVSLGFGVPANLVSYARYRQWGRLAVLPGSAVVAAACVGFSRLLNFLPGYLFGLIAGFTFRNEEDEKTEGRLTAAGCLFILLVGIAAWIARGPVSAAAAGPGAGRGLFALEALLTAVFLLGLESLLFGLLPLRFLNGSNVDIAVQEGLTCAATCGPVQPVVRSVGLFPACSRVVY
ncbi:MAG: FGLLP motif-containing membrane protein [Acidimicrobiales bacterium]